MLGRRLSIEEEMIIIELKEDEDWQHSTFESARIKDKRQSYLWSEESFRGL
jgi:hypothetical protein